MSICQLHEVEMAAVNAWKDDKTNLHIQWECPEGCHWQTRNQEVMQLGWRGNPPVRQGE